MTDALIHLRVPAETKARWVRESRAEGKRLTDWIVEKVESTTMYYLQDGTAVMADQIRAAFEAGRAVLVRGRVENGTSTRLALDGKQFDTRGECYSMWDEAWTTEPKTLRDALQAAYE